MIKTIDISYWDVFKEIKKLAHEVNAYTHILDYFINTGRKDMESFKYYEEKYIIAHVEFTDMKLKFQEYLKTYLLDNGINIKAFNWHINYERQEVEVQLHES